MLAVVVGMNTIDDFLDGQHSIRLQDGPFAMQPLRFYRIQPWTFRGKQAREDTHSFACSLDLLIVIVDPVLYLVGGVPRGAVPDERPDALARRACRARRACDRSTAGTRRSRPKRDALSRSAKACSVATFVLGSRRRSRPAPWALSRFCQVPPGGGEAVAPPPKRAYSASQNDSTNEEISSPHLENRVPSPRGP